jgi:hypothetical protein
MEKPYFETDLPPVVETAEAEGVEEDNGDGDLQPAREHEPEGRDQ